MASIVRRGVAYQLQSIPAGASKGFGDPIPCDNYKSVSFLIQYQRGIAGAFFNYVVEFSNAEDPTNALAKWYQVAATQPAVIVPGTDVTLTTQRAILSYQATGPSVERFTTPVYAVSAKWVRISCYETVAAVPGTVFIEYEVLGNN